MSEISQTQKDKYCVTPLYEIPRVVKLMGTESRMITRENGKNEELLFNGHGISVWGAEKVLGMDDGDSCTIM